MITNIKYMLIFHVYCQGKAGEKDVLSTLAQQFSLGAKCGMQGDPTKQSGSRMSWVAF